MTRTTTAFFLNFAKALRAPGHAMSAERQRQKFISEYSHAEDLPDHRLRDLGLTRDQIRHAKTRAVRAGFGSEVTRES